MNTAIKRLQTLEGQLVAKPEAKPVEKKSSGPLREGQVKDGDKTYFEIVDQFPEKGVSTDHDLPENNLASIDQA